MHILITHEILFIKIDGSNNYYNGKCYRRFSCKIRKGVHNVRKMFSEKKVQNSQHHIQKKPPKLIAMKVNNISHKSVLLLH